MRKTDQPSQELCAVLQHRLDLIEPKLGHKITVNWNSRGYWFMGYENNSILHWERKFSFTRANEMISFLERVLDNKQLKERRLKERALRGTESPSSPFRPEPRHTQAVPDADS